MSLIKTRTAKPRLAIAATWLGLALAGGPAMAQRQLDYPQPAVPDPDGSELLTNRALERRLERDEKALRDLRQIVLQARAQGAPVEVRDAGPDPQVEALQARINELEDTLRRQTGQLEVMTHNADVSARTASEAKAANAVLAQRLDFDEKQIAALNAAPQLQAAPPPAADSGVLGRLPVGRGGQGSIEDQPGPPEGPGSELAAYRAARQTLDSGDYAGGAGALQDYLQRYPSSPRAPEASYWLGRTLALRNMHADAAAAYARALRGWPQSPWAGDAVIRLSASLIQLNRVSDACKALDEFQRRYAAKAVPAMRARARETRSAASCA
jgi:tol-pal system protein YbgF